MNTDQDHLALYTTEGVVSLPRQPYLQQKFIDTFADCWMPAEDIELKAPAPLNHGFTVDAVRIRHSCDIAISQIFP